MAGPGQAGSRVIVFAADLMGMITLPAKSDAKLIIDPDTVTASPVACQCFQPIPRRTRQIGKLLRHVQRLRCTMRHSSPACAVLPSSFAAEQIGGGRR